MEARYNCCEAIAKAFASSKLVGDPAFAQIVTEVKDVCEISCGRKELTILNCCLFICYFLCFSSRFMV